ncbi:DEAD/DEAH box helicase [Cohnella sp. CFH 77786]|uniref:DEAD/DEAH box helicase n=1 Tax=Cohnella sp. CFH 77786 TaxID=2662265 RepID=UPI001C610BE2|nr:DEAD/DEAH box helicase [Cohnella sp. CFH 77786]MBW5448739.1 DEAD/DEAH box helicase [Cohnella sp. CFH 77786]
MASFQELGIGEERAALLRRMGISAPTPIQEQAIPTVLAGRDVIGQAQTGTGKTLAFVLPMLERLNPSAPHVQGLIVSPTRELAIQITEEVKKLTAGSDYRVLAVYGGQDVEAQLHKLQKTMHIIVCTPGRLLDHLRRGTIELSHVKMLVLDEADQMLHMGFLNEVEEILRAVPYRRQTLLFSATMPANVRNLAARIMDKPEEVTVRGKQVTVKDIRQWAVETTDRAKQAALRKLIDEQRPFLAMIFCRTKRRASTLNEALQSLGYNSDELHGDLSQAKREQVMTRFRQAKLQLLVATDVAARGLDVEGVTHVYNYDIPQDVDSYIHRIGRTGRAGASGLAITFVAPRDRPELAAIENAIGMAMERVRLGAEGQGGAAAAAAEAAGERGARPRQGGRGSRAGGGGAPAPGGGKPQRSREGRPQEQHGRGRSGAGGSGGRVRGGPQGVGRGETQPGGRGRGGPQGGRTDASGGGGNRQQGKGGRSGSGFGAGAGKKSPIRSLRGKSR